MTGTVLTGGPLWAAARAAYLTRWPKAAIAEGAVIVAFAADAESA